MSRSLSRLCVDNVLYWPPEGDAPLESGFWKLGQPQEIKGRWEDIAEEVAMPDGSVFVSRGQVMVLQDLDTDGWLMLGTLADLEDQFTTSPQDFPEAWPIKKFEKLAKGKKRLTSANPNHVFRMAYLGTNKSGGQ